MRFALGNKRQIKNIGICKITPRWAFALLIQYTLPNWHRCGKSNETGMKALRFTRSRITSHSCPPTSSVISRSLDQISSPQHREVLQPALKLRGSGVWLTPVAALQSLHLSASLCNCSFYQGDIFYRSLLCWLPFGIYTLVKQVTFWAHVTDALLGCLPFICTFRARAFYITLPRRSHILVPACFGYQT